MLNWDFYWEVPILGYFVDQSPNTEASIEHEVGDFYREFLKQGKIYVLDH